MSFNIHEKKLYEHWKSMNDRLEQIAIGVGGNLVTDPSGSPGSSRLVAGDVEAGFYGFVHPSKFGLIDGSTQFSNDALRSNIGVGGTNEYDDPVWMKFSFAGKVLFVPLKPLSRSISWDQIYDAGCVYGTGDQGILPPNGRAGHEISITANNTVTNVNGGEATPVGFLQPDSIIATDSSPRNMIKMEGWANSANNGTFEVLAIDDSTITLDTTDLVNESANLDARIWNVDDEEDQDAEVTIGDHTYKVRLLQGAASDPADYGDNRGARGPANEWARLIMPLHLNAITGDWNYSYYDPAEIENWNIGLTDADLITHQDHGLGSYSWTQGVRGDAQSYRRLLWGYSGASFVGAYFSWITNSLLGFRPVLELLE